MRKWVPVKISGVENKFKFDLNLLIIVNDLKCFDF